MAVEWADILKLAAVMGLVLLFLAGLKFLGITLSSTLESIVKALAGLSRIAEKHPRGGWILIPLTSLLIALVLFSLSRLNPLEYVQLFRGNTTETNSPFVFLGFGAFVFASNLVWAGHFLRNR